jgi:four helix bundle protein
MRNPRSLVVWTRARALVLATYEATEVFPTNERFGLTSQMRRSVVGIGSNISEACGRSTVREFAATLQHAMAEASELEFQVLVAQDLRFGDPANLAALERQVVEIKKMLSRLIVRVRREIKQLDS